MDWTKTKVATNWDVADWSFLSNDNRHHVKMLISRRAYLAKQAARLPDGRRTYYKDEQDALDWVLGLILDSEEELACTHTATD